MLMGLLTNQCLEIPVQKLIHCNMASDKIVIRNAKREDCGEILRLIKELAEYEKMAHGVKIDSKVLEEDGFGPNPFFQCLVAHVDDDDKSLVGYVLFFNTYSTWEGKCVFMEDIYVTPEFRGKGIGLSLWKRLVKIGLEQGCSRCNFSVLNWNKPSIEFYERFGAVDLTAKEGWLCFRMMKNEMLKFVGAVKEVE